MADTLKFGPEWLRALSDGNSVTSPPPSPGTGAPPKYKLAEHRYGREEMLALFVAKSKVPEPLREAPSICVEKTLHPLVFIPPTEEEQRLLSGTVNSAAVLRLMGRGGTAPPRGASRGVSERGRGRGRGRGDGGTYFPRYDESESTYGRGRGIRTESWDEMDRDRRFDRGFTRAGFEEPPSHTSPRKEFSRSMSSDNWREAKRLAANEEQEKEEGSDWRRAGPKERWPGNRGSWRDDRGRHEQYDEYRPRFQRSKSGSWCEDDDDLPEWSTADADDDIGTFDSSGAFMSIRELKEQENRKRYDGEKNDTDKSSSGDDRGANKKRNMADVKKQAGVNHTNNRPDPAAPRPAAQPSPPCSSSSSSSSSATTGSKTDTAAVSVCPPSIDSGNTHGGSEAPQTGLCANSNQDINIAPVVDNKSTIKHLPPMKMTTNSSSSIRKAPPGTEDETAPNFEHIEQAAENLMATLDADIDKQASSSPQPQQSQVEQLTQGGENAYKWYYRDPQGELQGPFNTAEMGEWFEAGYFSMNLLVKRGCDEVFHPLGELIKRWGCIPFLSSQTQPPPAKKSSTPPSTTPALQPHPSKPELNAEQVKALQQQQLLIQQQAILRQYQLSSLVASLQQQEEFAKLPPAQQSAFAMQLMLKQQQPPLPPPQQQQPQQQPKLSPRAMGHPDENSSVWPNPSTTGTWTNAEAVKPGPPGGTAAPASVWDIEPMKMQTLESIEEMQRQELERKEKSEQEAKLLLEEERRKQEAEAEKRRQQREREELEAQRAAELERQRIEQIRREQEEVKRRLEEEQRLREEERRRREEEEENRRREEQEESRRIQEQEEKRRKEVEETEKKRQEEIKRRQEKAAEEQRRRLQEQQLANIQLPQAAQWASNQPPSSSSSNSQLSLTQIQGQQKKQQQEQHRKVLEQQQQQLLAIQQQQQKQRGTWSQQNRAQPVTSSTKSLLEIQQEQAKQQMDEIHRQQKQQQQTQVKQPTLPLATAAVWGSSNASHWAQEGAWANKQNVGFWDSTTTSTTNQSSSSNKKAALNNNAGFPVLGGADGRNATSSHTKKSNLVKTKKEEETVQRLFQQMKPKDEFTHWCEIALVDISGSVDIPTFVAFLKDVESPYEVHDYVRSYLGESKEAAQFAQDFIERRSKYKNHLKQQQQEGESMWGPAPAITPGSNNNNKQMSSSTPCATNDDNRSKNKKKKKMQKVDTSLLGFSCTADSQRVNIGEIDTLDKA